MSKSDARKKVMVTTSKKTPPTTAKSKTKTTGPQAPKGPLVFGRKNMVLVLTGIGLIALGLFLMSGGSQPSPDVWDESIIYSDRRTLIGPFVIILGLVVEIVAIFRNSGAENISENTAS